MSYSYWPNGNAGYQHLQLVNDTLSLLPAGGTVNLTHPSVVYISSFNHIIAEDTIEVGNVFLESSGIVTCQEISLDNTFGPNVRLLAAGDTLSLHIGSTAGTVYDTEINPPVLLDHLTVVNALQAGSINTVSVNAQAINTQFIKSVSVATSTVNAAYISASRFEAGFASLAAAHASYIHAESIVVASIVANTISVSNLLVSSINAGLLTVSVVSTSQLYTNVILTSTMSAVAIGLSSGTLAGNGLLTWNGEPLLTSSTNTAVQNWAAYPAVSDINANGKVLGGVSHFGQTGDATMGFVTYHVWGNDYSWTRVLGDFWVGEKKDYTNQRPNARFYVSKFQVGGNGGQNDVVCYPDVYIYPSACYFGSLVQPCQSFTIYSLWGVSINSAYGVNINGGGGVSILGGGGVAVTGGGGVTVTGLGGVAVTGGGGVAVTGGLGVTVTGGVGVAVTAGAGVVVSGGGGVAINGGGGIALTGGTLELIPDAVSGGGSINVRRGGHLNLNGEAGLYANAITKGDLGYLVIGDGANTSTNVVSINNISVLGSYGAGMRILNVMSPTNSTDAATKGYVDNVPIMQQVSIEFNTTLSSAVNCIYNFWPQQPSLNLTLPTASTVGTWITIANSSPLYTLQFNVTSPYATVSIPPNSSVRVVCGLDNDVLPSWFVC